MNAVAAAEPGLLGDTAGRDYSRKLQLFNAFAEPELRTAIAGLGLKPGMRILDAGCGTGEALQWLSAACGGNCTLIGIDLAAAHVAAARGLDVPNARILQGDVTAAPGDVRDLDLIWCVNTINHLRNRLDGVQMLRSRLKRGARLALGQSSFVPDMFFAWDSRLERLTNEAVRRYYRDRYNLQERDLTDVRSLLGVMREAGLENIRAHTFMIERVAPLDAQTRAYLLEAVFRSTWGERLRPYLGDGDYRELSGLCDPAQPGFALDRPDFHFLQTLTLITGERS